MMDYMAVLRQRAKEIRLMHQYGIPVPGEQKQSENTEFLILTNEEDCYWQESLSIRNFIIDNLEKTGEILNYSIYKIPNTFK